jgi:hypothetical protein
VSTVHQAPYSDRLIAFERLWHAKCRDGRLPARRDFSFGDFRPWLGSVAILEVVDGGADFRFVLHGTKIVERHRHDLTGQTVGAMSPAWRDTALPGYLATMRDKVPLYSRHRVRSELYDYAWERLIAPCAADGTNVDTMILVVEDIDYTELGP